MTQRCKSQPRRRLTLTFHNDLQQIEESAQEEMTSPQQQGKGHPRSFTNIQRRNSIEKSKRDLSPYIGQHYERFLQCMYMYPDVYDFFIEEASNRKVIELKKTRANEYYNSYIEDQTRTTTAGASRPVTQTLQRDFSRSMTPNRLLDQSRPVTSSSFRDQSGRTTPSSFRMTPSPERSTRTPGPRNRTTTPIKRLISKKSVSATSDNTLTSSTPGLRAPNNRHLKSDIKLDRSNQKLQKLYTKITKWATFNPNFKLSREHFGRFLARRYPNRMVNRMMPYFEFDVLVGFEAYVAMIEKFLSNSEHQSLWFIFDVLDINQDKYICSQDWYQAIKLQKGNYYDSDISKITQIGTMKKSRGVPYQRIGIIAERHDTVKELDLGLPKKNTLSNQVNQNVQPRIRKNQKQSLPYYHPRRPEALTLDDFLKIDFFWGKPQFLGDIVKYIAKYNIYKDQGQHPDEVRRKRYPSEDLIAPPFSYRNYIDDQKYLYYKALAESLQMYKPETYKRLLSKFYVLQDDSPGKIPQITLKSITKNFEKFFGAQCDHVAKRVFFYLSGPKKLEITKARFLQQVYNIIKVNKVKWAYINFDLYDSAADGWLTANEVSEMLFSLPPDTPIYDEWMVMADEFIESVVGKKRTKRLDSISP